MHIFPALYVFLHQSDWRDTDVSFYYTYTTLMERTYMMKEGQNAESTRWFVVYAGKKMYQNRKPAAAGCLTNPYGNISLICVIGTCS